MKKKFYFFLFMAALFASPTLRADITSNLVLHYTFDNITAGVIPDASGNSKDATVYGAASAVAGYSGQAINMTTPTDYVQLPNDINSSLVDYTVACWVKLSTVDRAPVDYDNYWGRIFDFGNGTSTNMFLCPKNGYPYYAIKANDTQGEQSVSSTTKLVADKWHHMAITCAFDQTSGTGTLIMYIDGTPVGKNAAVTITPSAMGTTLQNYIGKSQYADPSIYGSIDDFRVYSRALSQEDVFTLNNVPTKLIAQYQALNLAGDLTKVEANLTLPTTLADGVTVTWASTDSSIVGPTGVVTRPAMYKTSAVLTATLSYTSGGVTSTVKKYFTIITKPMTEASELVAKWDFTDGTFTTNADGTVSVTDESDNKYVAKCMNGAQIVTIGNSVEKFNVLSVRKAGEYFDMGTAIGEAVYGLTDYTVSLFYRKDSTDYGQVWSGYGQPLYGFSNSLALATTATGAMYFEPLRGRHVCTPDNYGSENTNFVGVGTNNTPLGSWHHICYSQLNNVGTLYIDGAQVATGAMQAPAITLRKAGLKGTAYNSIGRPFYSGDPQLSNTLIYGFNLFSVGLTADDIPGIMNITSTLDGLNAAYGNTPYNIYDYASLADLIAKAKTAKESNFTPGLTDLNAAITAAQALYDAFNPTKEGIDAIQAAIDAYNTAQGPWQELNTLIGTTDAAIALNYPGLPALKDAIASAKTAYAACNVTAETITALKTAISTYMKTQPASLANPIDYTWAITNPSFEEGEGGTLDPTSFRDGNDNGMGNYQYPKGWTVYLNHTGWCNAVHITDAPSNGVKGFETWAATINEFNVYQDVELKAGWYVLSAQIRTNAAAPYTQHIYCTQGDNTFNSPNLLDSTVITGTGWNGLGNWQTLYSVIEAKDGIARVGFNSNGFMQFDNMKLTYFGSDKPVTTYYTHLMANPSFEGGTNTNIDPKSVKLKNGNFNAPNGWNAYCNLDTTAGWCNMVQIDGTMSNGTKGFEMWCDKFKINEFNLSQKFVIPASGYYELKGDFRCDGSSPSKTDTINDYDAQLYVDLVNFPNAYSKKLGQDPTLNTGAGWNNLDAWRTLSLKFQASVGDTIVLGAKSSSFMQMDNFRLQYFVNANPNATGLTKKAVVPQVEIYPNPTTSILNVRGLNARANVKVFGMTGQRVFSAQSTGDAMSIDCSRLSQGLYMIRIESDGKVSTNKFMKK